MGISWAHIGTSVFASFLASLVECVEALTVVLAVGSVRGWRSALTGTGTAIAVLLLSTAATDTPDVTTTAADVTTTAAPVSLTPTSTTTLSSMPFRIGRVSSLPGSGMQWGGRSHRFG